MSGEGPGTAATVRVTFEELKILIAGGLPQISITKDQRGKQ